MNAWEAREKSKDFQGTPDARRSCAARNWPENRTGAECSQHQTWRGRFVGAADFLRIERRFWHRNSVRFSLAPVSPSASILDPPVGGHRMGSTATYATASQQGVLVQVWKRVWPGSSPISACGECACRSATEVIWSAKCVEWWPVTLRGFLASSS
jgi:hypothetical protein